MTRKQNRLVLVLFACIICLVGKIYIIGQAAAGQSNDNHKDNGSTPLLKDAKPSSNNSANVANDNSKAGNSPLLLKPGKPLAAGMQTEDIVATYDVPLAREQVAAYPESPEASFVLAVALTRTSMVEEALHEVRRARKLAEQQGGPAYFDHMINEYEEMLKSYPKDNRVRYGLAWAYYMKAYVLGHYAKSVATKDKSNSTLNANLTSKPNNNGQGNWHDTWVKSLAQPPVTPGTPSADVARIAGSPGTDSPGGTGISDTTATTAGSTATVGTPVTKSASDNTAKPTVSTAADTAGSAALVGLPSQYVPQVKAYYEAALRNLDQLLKQEPADIWARAYRAFLYAEYTGDLEQAMTAWKTCLTMAPANPAAYFFLGQGYLRQGNLKECFRNISKALALREMPLQ